MFDGAVEVSAETRLRVRPTGSTETGRVVEGGPLAADLPAGIYDVQAVRQQAGQVVSVRWAEKLVVMAYPDEGGRHLEVINFANEHGALQLRWPEGQAPDPAGVAVTVTRSGESRPTPPEPFMGPATCCWYCQPAPTTSASSEPAKSRSSCRRLNCQPTGPG